jgi:hypothetical protein
MWLFEKNKDWMIMEFLTTHNLLGLAIGIATFLVIGLFHPVVIKAEYHFGTRCWRLFLILGLVFTGLSVLMKEILCSTIMGVIGFSCFWSILEIFEQAKRVEKGWFPRNPKRSGKKPDL